MGLIGAASLLATGRYAIFHGGEEVGEERWSVASASDGGAVARGDQVVLAPHPMPSMLEWRARLSPLGRVTAIEASWRVGTRTVRAEHSSDGDLWRARILYGGHTREQEGDYPQFAEVLIGSHVLHTIMFHRYVLAPGAEHEFPTLVIGPPWFAAEPGRQKLMCTATGEREVASQKLAARRIEVSDPHGAVAPFAAWIDEHDVVLESYEDTHGDTPWMRLTEYQRG